MMEARTMTVAHRAEAGHHAEGRAAKIAAEKARQQAEKEGRAVPPSDLRRVAPGRRRR